MALELDAQGDLREVRADGAQLPEVAAACIASIARRGDYSSLTGDQIVTGFELEKTVIELRWVDGYPYSREPVPDG